MQAGLVVVRDLGLDVAARGCRVGPGGGADLGFGRGEERLGLGAVETRLMLPICATVMPSTALLHINQLKLQADVKNRAHFTRSAADSV